MALKNIIPKNNENILLNHLKEKKNWFLISFVVMLVTVIILPIIIQQDIQDENIVIGMVEIFVIVFLNIIIDFDYLHDSRKLAYFESKPITLMQRIQLIITANMIFTTILVALLGAIAYFSHADIGEVFIVGIPWLFIGIVLAALSSLLTGNSIAAAFATVFNFVLPMSFLGVTYYIFQMIEDFTLGFNSDILMSSFIEKYYRIDYLYFIKYADTKLLSVSYFVIFAIVMAIIYTLLIKVAHKRKNERAGDLVVFDGYKNFVAILIAALVPIGFSMAVGNESFIVQIVVFILLASLAYYIMLAILEKSFKISKSAYKILIGFIMIFLFFIGGANLGTNKYEAYVPAIDEISSVYVGNASWVDSEYYEEWTTVHKMTEDYAEKAKDICVYNDSQNLNSVIKLHQAILEDQGYKRYENVVIKYFLKDGTHLTRYYELNNRDAYTEKKDQAVNPLINSLEYKEKAFNYIYDDGFAKEYNLKNLTFTIDGDRYESIDVDLETIDVNRLRMLLQSDYNQYLKNSKNALYIALNGNARLSYKSGYGFDEPVSTETASEDERYTLIFESYDEKVKEYQFQGDFKNTLDYMNVAIGR